MIALIAFAGVGCAGTPRHQPLVIAHRGASGYLPEHTLAAYAMAYAQGADVIEPDLVLTRDGVLICAHDTTAQDTTTIAAAFPDRVRSDGKWYFADFTLAEVRTLEARGRDGAGRGHLVPTFDEMAHLVRTLNDRTGRAVAIIPEPKRPAWHAEHGLDMLAAVETALAFHHGPMAMGLRAEPVAQPPAESSESSPAPLPIIIQCFELDFLRALRERGSTLELVWLIGDPVTDAALDDAATIADALGPARRLLQDEETGAWTDLWARAEVRRLALYPYTFKDEPEATRRFLRRRGVAGVFTDYPDVAARARSR